VTLEKHRHPFSTGALGELMTLSQNSVGKRKTPRRRPRLQRLCLGISNPLPHPCHLDLRLKKICGSVSRSLPLSNPLSLSQGLPQKPFMKIHPVMYFEISRFVFSERELMFMFAICRRPSVCRLSVCL